MTTRRSTEKSGTPASRAARLTDIDPTIKVGTPPLSPPAAIKDKDAPPKAKAPRLDIIDAMRHPDLFGSFFEGESWRMGEIVLKAAFALPMTDEEKELFRTISGRDPPAKRVKELWAIFGRGGGKDSLASLIAAFAAMTFPNKDKLRPGERPVILAIACDVVQARIIHSYIVDYFRRVPALKKLVLKDTQEGLLLKNGIDIIISTNNYKSTRGRPVLAAILDECAFYPDLGQDSSDQELYDAIKPGTLRASVRDYSMIIGISSPYRRGGLLYKKWSEHYGQPDDDVLVVKAPTRTMNPTYLQSDIDRELRRDYAAASAEYLAEWRDALGNFLTRGQLEPCIDYGVTMRHPVDGVEYVAFCDPSGGGGSDSMTMAIGHLDIVGEQDIAVIDYIREVPGPLSPETVTREFSDTLRRYHCWSVTGDKYGSKLVIESFSRHAIQYIQSEKNRSQLYLDFLYSLADGASVRLLDNEKMVRQFLDLQRKTTPSGDKIDHPARASLGGKGHDDISNVVAAVVSMILSTPYGVNHDNWIMGPDLDENPTLTPEQIATKVANLKTGIAQDERDLDYYTNHAPVGSRACGSEMVRARMQAKLDVLADLEGLSDSESEQHGDGQGEDRDTLVSPHIPSTTMRNFGNPILDASGTRWQPDQKPDARVMTLARNYWARQGEINAKAAETHKALGGAAGILAQNAQAAADARRAAIDAENARIQAIRDDFKRRGIP